MKLPCRECICLSMCLSRVNGKSITRIIKSCNIIKQYLDRTLPNQTFNNRVNKLWKFYREVKGCKRLSLI